MSTLIVFDNTVARPASFSPKSAAVKLMDLFPIQTAFGFGEDSHALVEELGLLGAVWGFAAKPGEDPAQHVAFYDLCVCMGVCDEMSPEETDAWVDYLTKVAPIILFSSGIPGGRKQADISTQVEDYWVSMFEIRGYFPVDGFATRPGHLPLLFASQLALKTSPRLKQAQVDSDLSWRDVFRTGPGEVRASEPVKQRGPDTSGQTRRTAASVVTFQPNAEQLEHVRHLSTLFDCVIVVDNSDPSIEPVPGVEWVSMGGNKGIAAALNAVCKRAKELGYEWLFTLDQDTDVDREHLDVYLEAFRAFNDKDGTAIVAPRTDGRDLLLPGETAVRELEMVMTSGCFTNLDIWEKIGGFSDELFIDEVDHDYCLNARQHGYRVVRLVKAYLPHQPGRLMTILTLRGRPTLVAWHPPIRLYYIVRNYFFMKRRYKDVFPDVIAERKRLIVAKFREYLLYHQDRWPSVFAMVKGAIHGFLGKFGK